MSILSIRPIVVICCLMLSACGRYGPPLAPEALSPRAVKNLKVSPLIEGIEFTWGSPSDDLRGEKLKSIEGYKVVRKEITSEKDVLDDDVEYDTLATIPDTHLEVLDKLKDEAKEVGKPTRKIKVPDSLKAFSYRDQELSAGKKYVYKIIPVNQGGTEGQVKNIIHVLFRGLSSEIQIVGGIEGVDTDEIELADGAVY